MTDKSITIPIPNPEVASGRTGVAKPPLVLFIIPLVNRRYAHDWGKVGSLLEETLASIRNQSDPSFHCLIISDEMPPIADTANISFLKCDFQLDDPTRYGARCVDKQKKVYLGLLEARKHNPGYVMILDGDDLIHRELLSFVRRHPQYDSFVLSKGYFLEELSRRLVAGFRMERACASTSIFRFKESVFPSQRLEEDEKAFLKFPLSCTPHVSSPREAFSSWGYRSRDLPFRAVIYRVHPGAMSIWRSGGSGSLSNTWRMLKASAKRVLLGRKMGTKFAAEFSLRR